MATQTLITWTQNAHTQMERLLSKKPASKGLCLKVVSGGCAGMGYNLDYVQQPPEGAQVIEKKGVAVYLPSDSLLFLIGCEIDYVIDALEKKFVFKNPNQTDSCGCGESVTLQKSQEDPSVTQISSLS